jgi:5-bromo-4-chloroindolyl phosphate hydrolysis protein
VLKIQEMKALLRQVPEDLLKFELRRRRNLMLAQAEIDVARRDLEEAAQRVRDLEKAIETDGEADVAALPMRRD